MEDKTEKNTRPRDIATETLGNRPLRESLAEKADNWSKASRRFADHWSYDTGSRRYVGNGFLDGIIQAAGADAFWIPAKVVELTSSRLRDRLAASPSPGPLVEK